MVINNTLLIIAAANIIVWGAVYLVWKKMPSVYYRRRGVPYQQTPILTNNEISFLKKLKQAIPEYQHQIYVQVNFSAFMTPKMQRSNPQWMTFFRKISQKRCDYLIVDNIFNPLFIVECDDNSHNNREKEDRQRDQLVMSVGIPTIRLRNNDFLTPEHIRSKISEMIPLTPRTEPSMVVNNQESQ